MPSRWKYQVSHAALPLHHKVRHVLGAILNNRIGKSTGEQIP
jgi:hypothetical protein